MSRSVAGGSGIGLWGMGELEAARVKEPGPQVLCPTCHTAFEVDPGWRLVQCPRCGAMITRMGEDAAYD